jgi:hypothetical protein
MKKIFTPICLLISSLSFAQISILNTDIPRVNDTIRYSETTVGITAAQAAKTGVDTIWDFSKLKAVTQDIEKFYAPSNTPYVLQFGILNAATYGIKDDALNALAGFGGLSGITIENVYGFYKNSSTANVLMGRGITVSGIPLALNFNPRDTVYKFPLNYGDKDTTYFKGTASIPSVGGITQQGRRINKVDGWGLIKTPYGQFNCIRIRTDITETDTIEISTFKIPIPNNRTIYTWYAKNEHYPILEITQTTGLAAGLTIRYKDINRPEVFYSAARFNASRTNASVLDTVNLTSTSTGSPKSYQWTITPNTVSFVGGTNATTNNPRVIFNAGGVYTIKLKVIYEGGQDDTTRIDYVKVQNVGLINTEKTIKSIDVYPNPAKTNIYITSNYDLSKSEIVLYDILGKKTNIEAINFINNSNIQLNINSLNKGVYFIKINDENNSHSTHKIIVE